jgi:hypothetical protein
MESNVIQQQSSSKPTPPKNFVAGLHTRRKFPRVWLAIIMDGSVTFIGLPSLPGNQEAGNGELESIIGSRGSATAIAACWTPRLIEPV